MLQKKTFKNISKRFLKVVFYLFLQNILMIIQQSTYYQENAMGYQNAL